LGIHEIRIAQSRKEAAGPIDPGDTVDVEFFPPMGGKRKKLRPRNWRRTRNF